jgi:hypothetical protein
MKRLSCAVAALTLAVAAPAFAQQSPSTGMAPNAQAAGSAASDASVTTGMSVKDKTGAAIGQVTEVKADASGKKVATVKMGAQTFAVETDKLAVKDGSAMINATQAEVKQMLPKR